LVLNYIIKEKKEITTGQMLSFFDVNISLSGISSKVTQVNMFSGLYRVLSEIILSNRELRRSHIRISFWRGKWL